MSVYRVFIKVNRS